MKTPPFNERRLGLLCLGVLVLAGCVATPKGWSSKQEIAQTVAKNIHVGDSKNKVEEFLTREGIRWYEATPTSISCWVVVGHLWPVTYEAGATFSIGKDGRVEEIKVLEEATGP